jgi:hypothetical protein
MLIWPWVLREVGGGTIATCARHAPFARERAIIG